MLNLNTLIEKQQSSPSPFVGKSVPYSPKRILCIDGDYLAYFASASPDTDSAFACYIANQLICEMQVASGAAKVFVCLTSRGSPKALRYLFAPEDYPYQGQRHGVHPANWEIVRTYLEHREEALFTEFLEADDIIRMFTTLDDYEIVVATRDKDLRMCTGCYHLDWKEKELTYVPKGSYYVPSVCDPDLYYGTKFFCYQLLVGDTADHIKGLPFYTVKGKQKKMGSKTALKMLANTNTLEEGLDAVIELYKSFDDDYFKYLSQQILLLWIKEKEELETFHFKTKYPRLYLALVRLFEEVYGEYREANGKEAYDLERDTAIQTIRKLRDMSPSDLCGESCS